MRLARPPFALLALGALAASCVLPAYEVRDGAATSTSSSSSAGGGDAGGAGGAGNGSTVGAGGGGGLPAPIALATGLCDVGSIAVVGQDVYFATDIASKTGKILRVPRDGSSEPVPILTDADHPADIAADPSWVFWVEGAIPGRVMRADRDGANETPLQIGQNAPNRVTLDGSYVYWSIPSVGGGVIQRVPKATGSVDFIASNLYGVTGLAVDDASVYWTEKGSAGGLVRTTPKTGGQAVTDLATAQNEPSALALGIAQVFWTNGEGSAVVSTCPVTGGNTKPVVVGAALPSEIVVDATRAYFFEQGSELAAVPIDGGDPVVIAADLQVPGDLADGDDALFFVDRGVAPCEGALYRVPKP